MERAIKRQLTLGFSRLFCAVTLDELDEPVNGSSLGNYVGENLNLIARFRGEYHDCAIHSFLASISTDVCHCCRRANC